MRELLFLLFPFKAPPPPPSQQRQEYRKLLAEMDQLFQEATRDGLAGELAAALQALAGRGEEIQRAVIAWIHLIDVLVDNAEQRHRARRQGAIKAAEVKAVVLYLVRTDKFQFHIPNVPDFLEPILIEVVVSWSIDTVVAVLKDHNLLVSPPPTLFGELLAWMRRVGRLFWIPLAWLGSWLWRLGRALRVRVRLSRKISTALQAIEREGILVSKEELVRTSAKALFWIDQHPKTLRDAVRLVFHIVTEVQKFSEKSGPEKKAAAREFFFAVLDHFGFTLRSGLVFTLVEALVDIAIEAAVDLFKRRRVFTSPQVR